MHIKQRLSKHYRVYQACLGDEDRAQIHTNMSCSQVMLRDMICPSYYKRGSNTDTQKDLWSMVCSENVLRNTWQCKQIILTLARREGHPLATSESVASLKEIKMGGDQGGDVVDGDDQETFMIDIFS